MSILQKFVSWLKAPAPNQAVAPVAKEESASDLVEPTFDAKSFYAADSADVVPAETVSADLPPLEYAPVDLPPLEFVASPEVAPIKKTRKPRAKAQPKVAAKIVAKTPAKKQVASKTPAKKVTPPKAKISTKK